MPTGKAKLDIVAIRSLVIMKIFLGLQYLESPEAAGLRCNASPPPGTADTPASSPLSIPRDSAAPGFSGSHNVPESERSRESAAAKPFSAPAYSQSGTSRLQSAPHSTHAARSPGRCHADSSTPDGAARASQFSCQHVPEHRLVQRQFCYQPLQPGILICSCLNWRTWSVSSPLYCFFHRYSVCSIIPTCRISSATGAPTSASFSTATIYSTEKRFLFTANLPSLGNRSCRKLTLIVCQKSGSRSMPVFRALAFGTPDAARVEIYLILSICKPRILTCVSIGPK